MEAKERRRPRALLAAVLVGVVVGAAGLAGEAQAQVPPLPSLPPQVIQAFEEVEGLVGPVLTQAAITASPAATAGGFVLRPGCSLTGYVALVLALGGSSLPINPFGLLSPVFIFCGAAFAPGPADPYFQMVDELVGPTLSSTVINPVERQIHSQLAPVRPDLNDFCGVAALAPRMDVFPPPAYRIDLVGTIC